MTDDFYGDLIREYETWNKANGLNLGSADEHLFDESLTAEQRVWLADFSRRWEDAAGWEDAEFNNEVEG